MSVRTRLVAAGMYGATLEVARCLVIDGDRIDWLGDDPALAPPSHRTIDMGSAWITPAFVDAHVHATWTGLALDGVPAAVARSAAELCDLVHRHAESRPEQNVLFGAGWDDFAWPERRPPTADDLAEAAPGRTILLMRVDGHSCLVDPGTLRTLPLERLFGVDRDAAGQPTGWLKEEASQAAQTALRSTFSPAQLAAARTAACAAAARLGIGSFHEMGHPGLSGLDDARVWRDGSWPLDVQVWWAELDADRAADEGLRPGGDLFLDGSIGSCTAATTTPYGPDQARGELFYPDDAVAEWFTACTRAGSGAGVHAIGDRAIEQALVGIEAAAAEVGVEAVQRCRHRIEHVEMPTRDQVVRMARLGVVASIQPAFDRVWGGDAGLYAERFGVEAARSSNPIAWFAEAGVVMAFGSDSTVTPLDPWGGVRAALKHRGGLGIDGVAALHAHTAGGRFVAGQDDVGLIAPGLRADLAVWDQDPFAEAASEDVQCLATYVRGTSV